MNLEKLIEIEVKKWCMKSGWDEYNEPAIDFSASLHSIAMATADALRFTDVVAPTYPSENSPDIYGNARIKAYQNGYKSAISDSRNREQKWFGKDLTSK